MIWMERGFLDDLWRRSSGADETNIQREGR